MLYNARDWAKDAKAAASSRRSAGDCSHGAMPTPSTHKWSHQGCACASIVVHTTEGRRVTSSRAAPGVDGLHLAVDTTTCSTRTSGKASGMGVATIAVGGRLGAALG